MKSNADKRHTYIKYDTNYVHSISNVDLNSVSFFTGPDLLKTSGFRESMASSLPEGALP